MTDIGKAEVSALLRDTHIVASSGRSISTGASLLVVILRRFLVDIHFIVTSYSLKNVLVGSKENRLETMEDGFISQLFIGKNND